MNIYLDASTLNRPFDEQSLLRNRLEAEAVIAILDKVEALEALAGDRVAEQVERLAHHALRGEVWDKAVAYCRQAGEKALARSAHRKAVGSCEQALSALPHLPEQRNTREQARVELSTALALYRAMEMSLWVPQAEAAFAQTGASG